MKYALVLLLVLWSIAASADGLINRGRGAGGGGGGGGGGGCNGVIDMSLGCTIPGMAP